MRNFGACHPKRGSQLREKALAPEVLVAYRMNGRDLPQVPIGLCGILGAGAVLAATTQGPISNVVLMMELTGRDRSFILPLLLAATVATLVGRSIEPRSVYDARLSDEEIRTRQQLREKAQVGPNVSGE